ncbi:sensor histidine kinase [Clavibacter capsici]|uniref:sensor histidine kinase n=1 Tax=Clavibacter capsici TaxID=1874630 RepID=UPI00293E281A|nr:ATP-binding protein [Clavibacter capsici]
MVRTLSLTAPLLALLSLPSFAVSAQAGPSHPAAVSLCVAALMVVAVPAAIVPRGLPAYACLRISIALYLALIALEPMRLGDTSVDGSPPWLVTLSCIAFACVAIVVERPLLAYAACLACVAAIGVIYAGHLAAGPLLVQVVGLAGIAAALVLGARALRSRATAADEAERRARDAYASSRRAAAVAAERIRTDALLHDTVLAVLLSAAGHDPADRILLMARSALDILTGTTGGPDARGRTVRFADALASAEGELAPLAGRARLDLDRAADVRMPTEVGDALVSAMTQALTNSVRHAGSATTRTVTADALRDGGVRIRVRDDGTGFDPDDVGPEQLGVRVSIVERLRQVGGDARIRSSPGDGTTVVLVWRPATGSPSRDAQEADPAESIVSRRALYATMTVLVVGAIVAATLQVALVHRAPGPVVGALIGVLILPAIVRGARAGRMRTSTAWVTGVAGLVICAVGPIGLSARDFDSVSVSWLTCGVLSGCVLVWMSGRRLQPLLTTSFLVATVAVWGGVDDVVRLGLAAEIVLVAAGLVMHGALHRITDVAQRAATDERATLLWQAELDAYQRERQDRLRMAETEVAPVLRRIISRDGELDADGQAECRVLEQTLRDEIRGRRLLDDGMREVIRAHRRRGALVQVLDDGGVDDLDQAALDDVLHEVAERLRPVRSSRIVIRTGDPATGTAVTIVASSPDETAVALGLDADDEVDLWMTIPRPTAGARVPTAVPGARTR